MRPQKVYAYFVVYCHQDGTEERRTNVIIFSPFDDLHMRQFDDDNPRSMGSMEFLEPMNGGEPVIAYGSRMTTPDGVLLPL